jgi:hypothetical protein
VTALDRPHSAAERPEEPEGDAVVTYRGWEIGYDWDQEFWTDEGWTAAKGGFDLGAICLQGARFCNMLDEIDAQEDAT